MTPSSGAGDPKSAPVASTAILFAPPRGTSSKPAACAGFPPCYWCTYHGPIASWALPFLTVLAPSKRFYAGKLRSPKTLVDWARQAALQIRRWLPSRYIVLVADSAFAAIEFLAAVRHHVCVITRLRFDANLFASPPPKRKGRGRPAIKGKRLKKLSAILKDPKVHCQRCRISLWYGRTNRLVEITSGTALWYRAGVVPVPIRWVIVRDPKGDLDPQAFLATDLDARPQDILAWFVRRWQVEVTFDDL